MPVPMLMKQNVLDPPAVPEVLLGQRRQIDVVLEHRRSAEGLPKLLHDIGPSPPRQVAGSDQGPASRVIDTRACRSPPAPSGPSGHRPSSPSHRPAPPARTLSGGRWASAPGGWPRACTDPERSAMAPRRYSRPTSRPSTKRASGRISYSTAAGPRTPVRRPATLTRPSRSKEATATATVGLDSPDIEASSVREIGPSARTTSSMSCSFMARISLGRAATEWAAYALAVGVRLRPGAGTSGVADPPGTAGGSAPGTAPRVVLDHLHVIRGCHIQGGRTCHID